MQSQCGRKVTAYSHADSMRLRPQMPSQSSIGSQYNRLRKQQRTMSTMGSISYESRLATQISLTAIQSPCQATKDLKIIDNTTLNMFLSHCATLIQSQWRMYRLRKLYLGFQPILGRFRELLCALVKGWKVRKLLKCRTVKRRLQAIFESNYSHGKHSNTLKQDKQSLNVMNIDPLKVPSNGSSLHVHHRRILKRQLVQDINYWLETGAWVRIVSKPSFEKQFNAKVIHRSCQFVLNHKQQSQNIAQTDQLDKNSTSLMNHNLQKAKKANRHSSNNQREKSCKIDLRAIFRPHNKRKMQNDPINKLARQSNRAKRQNIHKNIKISQIEQIIFSHQNDLQKEQTFNGQKQYHTFGRCNTIVEQGIREISFLSPQQSVIPKTNKSTSLRLSELSISQEEQRDNRQSISFNDNFNSTSVDKRNKTKSSQIHNMGHNTIQNPSYLSLLNLCGQPHEQSPQLTLQSESVSCNPSRRTKKKGILLSSRQC